MNYTLYNLFDSTLKKEVEFICPSCGNINKISNKKCESCSYDLSQTKSVLFSHYYFFNNAIKYEKEENYFEAIIEISKYLAYEPADETANKMYIYYLNKLGRNLDAQNKLAEFEKLFPRNPWIMQIETRGLDSIESPTDSLRDIDFDIITNQLIILNDELTKTRIQTTQELASIAINFYSNLLRPALANKELYYRLNWFYENVIIAQLAKREIRLETFEGKNYNELSTNDVACIDVKSTIEYKDLPDGTIITDIPAVYIRSSLIKKQQVYVVKNSKKEEEQKAKTKKNNPNMNKNIRKKKHGVKK